MGILDGIEYFEVERWQAGQRLPSFVEAAKQFGVDEATISKAYRVLAEEKLVVILPGQGTFLSHLTKEQYNPY